MPNSRAHDGIHMLRYVVMPSVVLCLSCGGGSGEAPGVPLSVTSPRSLSDLDDEARHLLFDEIIECENEGLRQAAELPLSSAADEERRMMRQHAVEAECKDTVKMRERLSAQQLAFLRTYGMQQGWFTAHVDEAPARRAPLGDPTSLTNPQG